MGVGGEPRNGKRGRRKKKTLWVKESRKHDPGAGQLELREAQIITHSNNSGLSIKKKIQITLRVDICPALMLFKAYGN